MSTPKLSIRDPLLRAARGLRGAVRRVGLDVVRYPGNPDFDKADRELIARVQPYTLTTPERIIALARAVEYVVERDIAGDIVECGVWKGGSMMAAALTLVKVGDKHRRLYLFDTYEGMSAPTADDVASFDGRSATELMRGEPAADAWWAASLEEVKENLASTGFDTSRAHFVKGMVEETIPHAAPDAICLLRLDTDWYESTRHELVHLYPRLSMNGVLIIDDYGFWRGSRKATDEYFSGDKPGRPLLNRIDSTGRVAVKT